MRLWAERNQENTVYMSILFLQDFKNSDNAKNLSTIFIYRQRSLIAGLEFTHLWSTSVVPHNERLYFFQSNYAVVPLWKLQGESTVEEKISAEKTAETN